MQPVILEGSFSLTLLTFCTLPLLWYSPGLCACVSEYEKMGRIARVAPHASDLVQDLEQPLLFGSLQS